jgi:hypothetical protein
MKKLLLMLLACTFVLVPAAIFASPTVYPMGTTIYKPEKCENGYTVLSARYAYEGRMNPVIDMNGNEVNSWTSANKGKLLPGGVLFGTKAGTDALALVDWDDNIIKEWDAGYGQHHDQQLEGNPVGYYVPGMEFNMTDGLVLILGGEKDPLEPDDDPDTKPKEDRSANPGSTDQTLVILDWDNTVVWEWHWNEHYSDAESMVAYGITLDADDLGSPRIDYGNNRLFNTAAWLGPNRHYPGDDRFHPDNILVETAFGDRMFIVEYPSGNIVWSVGPDFSAIPQLKNLGYPKEAGPFNLVGMGAFVGGMLHHGHMIPEGLPGEGNILVFNNGGPYSLVTEFDPVTLEIVWEYSGRELGYGPSHNWAHTFYSGSESSAQRLPNGNTLICEADEGRIFEVTEELETVWEYINPRMWKRGSPHAVTGVRPYTNASTYRAYRVPYSWVPQLTAPVEAAVTQPDNTDLRVQEPVVPAAPPAPSGWGSAGLEFGDGGGGTAGGTITP